MSIEHRPHQGRAAPRHATDEDEWHVLVIFNQGWLEIEYYNEIDDKKENDLRMTIPIP